MSAASELQTHVAELQMKALDAGDSIDEALEVLRQRCNALPDGDSWLGLLQPLTAALSTRHSYSDEALRLYRAAVTAGICSGPVLASAQASPEPAPSAKYPHYMADLVDRAASHLLVHGVGAVVSFTWWADGEEVPYTARLVWNGAELAPRLMVCRARSGDFVCQSLVGNFFEIDPSTWCIDVPSDEIDREIWERAQRKEATAAP